MSTQGRHGNRDFSGGTVLTVGGGGGTATASIVDAETLGKVYNARPVLETIQMENVDGDKLSLYFIDRNLSLHLLKEIGPGESWHVNGVRLTTYLTEGVDIYVALQKTGAAAEASVWVSGFYS